MALDQQELSPPVQQASGETDLWSLDNPYVDHSVSQVGSNVLHTDGTFESVREGLHKPIAETPSHPGPSVYSSSFLPNAADLPEHVLRQGILVQERRWGKTDRMLCLMTDFLAVLDPSVQSVSYSDPGPGILLHPDTFKDVSLGGEIVGGGPRSFCIRADNCEMTFSCKDSEEAAEWVETIRSAAQSVNDQCQRQQAGFVYVNVYDLAKDWRVGMFNTITQDVFRLGGVFHAGVEVYGVEYMFGSTDGEE
eukprot:4778582-Amphidinium_carterae.1